jgi:hypothetical protein
MTAKPPESYDVIIGRRRVGVGPPPPDGGICGATQGAQRQPVGGVLFGTVDDTAARKLVMQWEHAASETDTRTLFLNARDDAAQVLADLVTDDVRALAVAPLTLALVAGEAILSMTISGTPEEPMITVELWPTRLPTVRVAMVERFESLGKADSPRQRTWTFSPADAQPITVSHRRVAAPFPDESERADFARLIAERAGWPFPSPTPPQA